MRRLISILCVLILTAPVVPAFGDQNDARLAGLFDDLKAARDAGEGQKISTQIWEIWTEHGDDQIDLVMAHGIVAMNLGSMERALQAFNVVVELAPEFAEGWNKRATVLYYMDNFDGSARDIKKTLALEPRHFGALSGLGLVSLAIGRDEAALEAFEKALEINPHMPHAQKQVKTLSDKLKGKRI